MPIGRQISRWRPQTGDGSVKLGYLAALGGAMVGLIVRLLLDPYVDHRALVIIYVPAVLAASQYNWKRPVGCGWPMAVAAGRSVGASSRPMPCARPTQTRR